MGCMFGQGENGLSAGGLKKYRAQLVDSIPTAMEKRKDMWFGEYEFPASSIILVT